MKFTQSVTSLYIITFQKSFLDLKSTKNIRLKYLGLYVKHSLHTYKCSSSYFNYFMLQNEQSNGYSLHIMTSVVVLFAYLIKLNISTRKGVT